MDPRGPKKAKWAPRWPPPHGSREEEQEDDSFDDNSGMGSEAWSTIRTAHEVEGNVKNQKVTNVVHIWDEEGRQIDPSSQLAGRNTGLVTLRKALQAY